MRFVGHGHPAIRATHDKTLEFSPDAELTDRGTCIVSVGTSMPGTAVAGPIRLRLTATDRTGSTLHTVLDAVGNPDWDTTGAAVVRRSPHRASSTFATEATAAAAELPEPLVTALQDPATSVTVEVTDRPSPPTVVLAWLPGVAENRLAAEITAADLVVAEDDLAAERLGVPVTRGAVPVTGRVLVGAAVRLPGHTVADRALSTRVEVAGLPVELCAAAALPGGGAVLLLDSPSALPKAVRSALAGSRLVVRTSADRAAALATEVDHPVLAVTPDRPPLLLDGANRLDGRGPAAVAVLVTGDRDALDPATVAAVRGLLADGVATKTVARALAALTDQPQNRAYDTVLGLRGRDDPRRG